MRRNEWQQRPIDAARAADELAVRVMGIDVALLPGDGTEATGELDAISQDRTVVEIDTGAEILRGRSSAIAAFRILPETIDFSDELGRE